MNFSQVSLIVALALVLIWFFRRYARVVDAGSAMRIGGRFNYTRLPDSTGPSGGQVRQQGEVEMG